MVYVINLDSYNVELMIGKKIAPPLSVYAFWRDLGSTRQRLGFRMDYFRSFHSGRFSINLQFRYLWGLKKRTSDQLFAVPEGDYRIRRWLRAGVLGFYVRSDKGKAIAYLGPSLNLIFSKQAGLYLAAGDDLLSRNGYLALAKAYYKFRIGKKTN